MPLKQFLQSSAIGQDTWTEVTEFNFYVHDIAGERGSLAFTIKTWDGSTKNNLLQIQRYEVDQGHPKWADVLTKANCRDFMELCEDILLARPEFADADLERVV